MYTKCIVSVHADNAYMVQYHVCTTSVESYWARQYLMRSALHHIVLTISVCLQSVQETSSSKCNNRAGCVVLTPVIWC